MSGPDHEIIANASPLPWRTWLSAIAPLAGLLLVYTFFAIVGPPSFATTGSALVIARQTAIVGTAALGMTLIIISGGIDLSVGSMIALCTVVTAALLHAGYSPVVAALGTLVTGLACGTLNGTLVAFLRVGPFIVTLGTLLIFRGVAKGLANEQKIDAPLTWLNRLLAPLPKDWRWITLDFGVWIMLLLALLVAGLLRYTRLGKHTFAIGSNELTARLCGVPVARTKITIYALGGLLSSIAGLMQFSRLSVGDPTVAMGLELDIIAAVVIGGGSLAGGEGSILGTLVGALIMTTLRSGGSQMGWPNWRQEIITGVIIILAVALDRLRHRRST